MSDTPSGIVGLIISDRGHVFAEAADFDQDRQGGLSFLASQRRRMRMTLANRLVEALCSPYMEPYFSDSHDKMDLINKIRTNPEKFKMRYVETLINQTEEN